MDRLTHLHIVTKRLIVMTALAVAAATLIFGASFMFGERLMLTWLAFTCGIIGGFVSIQQRLKKGDQISIGRGLSQETGAVPTKPGTA